MTPQSTLIELLARVGAAQGAAVLISEEELSQWPAIAVAAMKTQKLIAKARSAATAICPGCERECVMPVHTPPTATDSTVSFIVCDKRSDINRVPVSSSRLVQWRSSTESLCGFIASCLGLRRREMVANSDGLWKIGVLAGSKRSEMLCLQADGELALIAGKANIPLVECIAFEKGAYWIDSSMVQLLVGSGTQGIAVRTTANGNPCDVFLAMENLDAGEVTIAFVGDKSEAGLAGNNMLYVAARKVNKHISLAALDLVDKRTGSGNSQAVILLGMALKKKLTRTSANAAKMKRLREVFAVHLGIRGDPFETYRKNAGWAPRFKIVDRRGALDERAKLEGERRTDSYDQLNERGVQFSNNDRRDPSSDPDVEDADEWLKKNDPGEFA